MPVDLSPWHLDGNENTADLNEQLKLRVHATLTDHRLAGTAVAIESGVRTTAEQTALFHSSYTTERIKGASSKVWNGTRYWKRRGRPIVAIPGTSKHERGLAVDFGWRNLPKLWSLLEQVAWDHGIYRTVDSEPWHYELRLNWTPPPPPPPPPTTLRQEVMMFIAKISDIPGQTQPGFFLVIAGGFVHYRINSNDALSFYQQSGLATVAIRHADAPRLIGEYRGDIV